MLWQNGFSISEGLYQTFLHNVLHNLMLFVLVDTRPISNISIFTATAQLSQLIGFI